LLFALSESAELGAQIADQARIRLAPLEERPFEEGEFKLRPLSSVRDRTVFVVQCLAGTTEVSAAQRLIRLLFLLFGLHDAGAQRMIAVVPYLSFARKDRRTQPRDPVNTRYMAQLLETTGLDRLIALDVHNPAALDNAFRIPVDHLSAIPMFVDHFATQCTAGRTVVASPDVGGVKRVQVFRELLEQRLGQEVELAFIEKRRSGGRVSGGRVVGQVQGCAVIVLDDLCASGGTLLRAAAAMREAGAQDVHAAVTHAPLPSGLDALVASELVTRVVVTDSVGAGLHQASLRARDKLCTLPIAPLFGQAIARMLAGAPLAPLLTDWPLTSGR
jgi:ribose-phosphate pyrophosphokinase